MEQETKELLKEVNFRNTAIRSGTQFQLYIPKKDAEAVGIKDRDELEITIRKTGRNMPKKRPDILKPFGRKEKEEADTSA